MLVADRPSVGELVRLDLLGPATEALHRIASRAQSLE